jgi:mannose-6-phosphate isomerase-like protein (cupin superfamily)
MSLQTSSEYQQLAALARESHEQGRNALDISPDDIARARLYCYAFRNHTIGAFHATRLAGDVSPRAAETLEDLAHMGMEAIPCDFRAVISTFYRYDRLVRRAIDSLQGAIVHRFTEIMSNIAAGQGVNLTRDTSAPEQANFIVPNLGITIVPLVYGDHHSWNMAWMSEQHLDVPWHRHHQGVEIHLGFEPLDGYMILDDFKSPVTEGYALPIPPVTRHGWANKSGHVHHVPFIFGSMKQAGWGVFLDVEAQPMPLEDFKEVDRNNWQMSNSVHLQREIKRMADLRGCMHHTLIPASVMDRNGSGGLELSLTRANETGFAYPIEDFRAVSVVSGKGRLAIGPVEINIEHHDHFGVPAGMAANVQQVGDQPLVLLDSLIKTVGTGG